MTLKETIAWLSVKSTEEKIIFNELLLSDMTTMNRAIWDDPGTTDRTKVECLKWSNELAHRIWNILFELKHGEVDNPENLLAENINFYRKQSNELAGHLGVTIIGTVGRFNLLREKTLQKSSLIKKKISKKK